MQLADARHAKQRHSQREELACNRKENNERALLGCKPRRSPSPQTPMREKEEKRVENRDRIGYAVCAPSYVRSDGPPPAILTLFAALEQSIGEILTNNSLFQIRIGWITRSTNARLRSHVFKFATPCIRLTEAGVFSNVEMRVVETTYVHWPQ